MSACSFCSSGDEILFKLPWLRIPHLFVSFFGTIKISNGGSGHGAAALGKVSLKAILNAETTDERNIQVK